MNQYLENHKSELDKSIEHFRKEISVLRTGRANPGILDGVYVSAYGSKTPLSGVASINVPDGQCITIAPWDKGIIKDVEKAIVEADLGVGVVNEGMQIRVNVPKMTEENRRDLVKKLNEKHEAARVSIRQIREEIKSRIETAEKDKEISEDDKFRFLKEMDEEVALRNDSLKTFKDKKEEEIMTI